jgi:hypothetical protein
LKLDAQQPILLEAERQLREYFSGTRTEFDLPLELNGSEFQKKVWRALREIPFGQTISYLHLATTLGSAKAVRAVGAANGKNPVVDRRAVSSCRWRERIVDRLCRRPRSKSAASGSRSKSRIAESLKETIAGDRSAP